MVTLRFVVKLKKERGKKPKKKPCVRMRDYKVLPQTRNVRGALAEMVTLRSVIKLKKNEKKRGGGGGKEKEEEEKSTLFYGERLQGITTEQEGA